MNETNNETNNETHNDTHNDTNNETTRVIIAKAKRPTSITVICVIGFFGALVSVPLVFSSLAQQVGVWSVYGK